MPEKKLTTYQKLKAENIKLKQDIYTILIGKDPIEQFSVRAQWNIRFKMEEQIWGGTHLKINNNG